MASASGAKSGLDGLAGRLSGLLASTRWSDCTLAVAGEQIPAHRLILASASPVFEAMFFGGLSASRCTVEDIPVAPFRKMLRFLYTDCVEPEDVDEAWWLVYAAEKYLVEPLKSACIEYIGATMGRSDLLMCYELSELYGAEGLKERCLGMIAALVGPEVFSGEYHVKAGTLRAILDRAAVLPDVVLQWANEERNRRNIEGEDGAWSVLRQEGLLDKLRAPGGRTAAKACAVLLRRAFKSESTLRTVRPTTIFTRVKASKCLVVLGVVLPMQLSTGCTREELQIDIEKDNGEMLASFAVANTNESWAHFFTLKFPDSVVFEENVSYAIGVTFLATDAEYPTYALDQSVSCRGVDVIFDDVDNVGILYGLVHMVL